MLPCPQLTSFVLQIVWHTDVSDGTCWMSLIFDIALLPNVFVRIDWEELSLIYSFMLRVNSTSFWPDCA